MQGKDELLSVLLDVGGKTTHTFKDFTVSLLPVLTEG